jgi:hypothetical protein
MNPWLFLILSLPTENSTARMRAWRALKASGAAVLRDGVYLLPDRESCQSLLNTVAGDVRTGGGTAHLIRGAGEADADFQALFDRNEDYAALLGDVAKLRDALTPDNVLDTLKQARKLRKALASLVEIDFFPGEAQKQTESALQELETHAYRVLSPNEPHQVEGTIVRLNPGRYRGRLWATRERPWVDRLASAWLIRRYIDSDARFVWLKTPSECPSNALGFDFDGATFTHVGGKVTFEVLVASFGLEEPALNRLGALVHYLDMGGVQPAEASGVERVLAGLRESITDDDRLLQAASGVFDGLLAGLKGNSQKDVDNAAVVL